MPEQRYRARNDPQLREPDPLRTPDPGAPPSSKDLTVNKVFAGAAAAATSALVGSLFGVEGTVLGAAVGSAISTIATALYQRSLDRTRDTVRARIRLPGGRTVDVAAPVDVPPPRVSPEGETGRARVYVTPALNQAGTALKHRRALMLLAIGSLVFTLGLLLVTGLELLTGSPLSGGEPGTSIGRVLEGDDAPSSGSGATPTPVTTPPENPDATDTSDPPIPTLEEDPSSLDQPNEPEVTVEPSETGDPDDPGGDEDLLPDREASDSEEPSPTAAAGRTR